MTFRDNIENILQGRAYIDGSTWLPSPSENGDDLAGVLKANSLPERSPVMPSPAPSRPMPSARPFSNKPIAGAAPILPSDRFAPPAPRLTDLASLPFQEPSVPMSMSSLGQLTPSREMTLSPLQANSRLGDWPRVLQQSDARTNAAIMNEWRRFAGPNAPAPSDQDKVDIFQNLPNVAPLNIRANVDALRSGGVGSVVDPEGRRGNPVYVAGTAPNGSQVRLSDGDIARMGDAMAYLHPMSRPGAPWGGTATRSENGRDSVIAINSEPNTTGTTPPHVLAHEIGHLAHNVAGTMDNPLAGASPEALAQFRSMAGVRASQPSSGRTLEDYKYFQSPREGFAEGIRAYLTSPNAFKSKYPEAAKFLRQQINGNPELSRLLMLSQNGDGAALA